MGVLHQAVADTGTIDIEPPSADGGHDADYSEISNRDRRASRAGRATVLELSPTTNNAISASVRFRN